MSRFSHVGAGVDPALADRPRHRIGDAARRIGVSTSALRLWERQGLVSPGRSQSGYRLYTDSDLERLRRIRRMRSEHLNAPGILRLMAPLGRSRQADERARQVDGSRLRTLRLERGLSLQDAAGRTGLSSSFLSALERNAAGASVSSLQRLTRTYGVTLLDLFAMPARGGRRVRPTERPALELDGVRIEQLAAGAAQLEPQLFCLTPGASSDGAYAHEGEEFLFVLDGAVTVWIGDDERYRLRAGDSLCFPSTLSHRWRNRAGGETRLLWINTPPTF
jgi:DNA-binding transcriptional MerR regulator